MWYTMKNIVGSFTICLDRRYNWRTTVFVFCGNKSIGSALYNNEVCYRMGSKMKKLITFGMALLCFLSILFSCIDSTYTSGDNVNSEAVVKYAAYKPTTPFGEGNAALLDGILRQNNGCIIVEIKDGSEVDGS